MFVYSHPDPVALSLGPIHVRWYGLMYLVGFALVLIVGRYAIRTRPHSTLDAWTPSLRGVFASKRSLNFSILSRSS